MMMHNTTLLRRTTSVFARLSFISRKRGRNERNNRFRVNSARRRTRACFFFHYVFPLTCSVWRTTPPTGREVIEPSLKRVKSGVIEVDTKIQHEITTCVSYFRKISELVSTSHFTSCKLLFASARPFRSSRSCFCLWVLFVLFATALGHDSIPLDRELSAFSLLLLELGKDETFWGLESKTQTSLLLSLWQKTFFNSYLWAVSLKLVSTDDSLLR